MPSAILFPLMTSSLAKFAIDNIVFEYGYKDEIEIELEREKSKIKLENQRFEIMLKLLSSR
ncbi:hypothetical protein H8E77_06820 [bacterium]|nr:hypothetical protein [bacterium]